MDVKFFLSETDKQIDSKKGGEKVNCKSSNRLKQIFFG